ncbi:hypothetical protein NDI42_26775, partial [Funiculus sociatus GB2-C1]
WIRPFLTVLEDAQMGHAGMGGEQQETLLLYHYILSTTKVRIAARHLGALSGSLERGCAISKTHCLQALSEFGECEAFLGGSSAVREYPIHHSRGSLALQDWKSELDSVVVVLDLK